MDFECQNIQIAITELYTYGFKTKILRFDLPSLK